MRFSPNTVLLCAAICAVWSASESTNAQNAPPAHGPFIFATTQPVSQVQPSSSKESSSSEAIASQSPDELSLEKPIYACACGCGIFEVGTASMFPRGQGGMLYLEYDYQDQNTNWGGTHPVPGSGNPDVNIRTNFITLGLQYFFDRSWGLQVELPYANRHFQTLSNYPDGSDATTQWGSFGDVRLQGIYTGFSEDQSIGVSFGVKLPTGSWNHSNHDPFGNDIDRDSEIGTGCVDLLLGGFFRHQFDSHITGFAQVALDAPIDECQGYRPGLEADAALGAYYTGLAIGGVQITPIAQILISERGHDSGPNATHPIQSGYQRLLLSPGLEFDVHPFSIYADIEIPVYQHFSGDQLSAPFLLKVILTYHF